MKKKFIGLFFILGASLLASDIVVDKETDLVWQDNSKIVQKSWSSAKVYCRNLSLGGHNNWRLPHIDELISIVDTSKNNPAIKKIFKNTFSIFYWSATEFKGNSSAAWRVDFNDGNDYYYSKSDVLYVRCVVGRQ